MISLDEAQIRVVICDEVKANETASLLEAVKKQRERCGTGLVYLAIIPEDAPMPDVEVRNAMTDGLRAVQPFCDYAAFVFCGAGLKASMKRTAFSTMLLAILKGKWHVAGSIDELIRKSGGDIKRVLQLRQAAKLAADKGYRV
jgi:hypothetical protein